MAPLSASLQGTPKLNRLISSAASAWINATDAVVAFLLQTVSIRLISSWSYPIPLAMAGAVVDSTIASTSASASFRLSISISSTLPGTAADSSSVLGGRRATCNVMPSGMTRGNSNSWVVLDDGSSRPIRLRPWRDGMILVFPRSAGTVPNRRVGVKPAFRDLFIPRDPIPVTFPAATKLSKTLIASRRESDGSGTKRAA